MKKGTLEFEIKVDASEMTKAFKNLGKATEDMSKALAELEKATIYFHSNDTIHPWYKRIYLRLKTMFNNIFAV